jgi:DNA-binding MarR family transcriptional regulator
MRVYRAHAAYRLALDRALGSVGLTTPQFVALSRLAATPGLSNAELARQTSVTPQTMNVILSRLESSGLVLRRPHPGHGLILLAELTPAGRKIVDQGFRRAEAIEAYALEALGADERTLLLDLLGRVGERITQMPKR